ncbi:MAG: hypothetical protein JWR90_2020 [Marmoricola sp.]|jgi:hypothetical protein|nr:hypothetical protein [Marmoricola sp.]
MKLYADTSVRRTLQILGDLAVVLWIWVWIEIADKVHDSTLKLATPGHKIDSSASDLAGRLRDAGRTVAKVPLVGDSVRSPFNGASKAATGLSEAGQQQVAAVGSLAHWLGLAVALIPILVLLSYYLPPRISFVRRATAGQRFLNAGADLDLFALRAMAHQPLHVLARLDPDPAGAWRRGDAAVIDELAKLELRSVGLRPPPRITSADDSVTG